MIRIITSYFTFLADNPLSKYCLSPRGQFPSKACNKYVNCWDDVVVEQECPSGLVFSEKGYCDYPYNVDCARRPIGCIINKIQNK